LRASKKSLLWCVYGQRRRKEIGAKIAGSTNPNLVGRSDQKRLITFLSADELLMN
jgi:hypothetical protein